MKIYYLKNSGFAVIMEHSLLVFDYYRLSPEDGGFEDGVVPKKSLTDFERVYFFVSHKHADHFNKGIYGLNSNPNTRYIVAPGTPKNDDPEKRAAIKEGESFSDDYLSVYAGGSTDLGVSFVVDAEGKRIFHAGDLNCWHWAGEWSREEEAHERKIFTNALGRLKAHAQNIDAAFFPVDPRLHEGYDDGAREFAEKFRPKLFIPMHCQNEYAVTDKFKAEFESESMKVFAYHSRGDSIEF